MGYVGIATRPRTPWFELVAIAFGIGMGLTMDEFALWLNLEDVYWQKKGRQSIDAVVVTTGLLFIALLGLRFWIDVWDAVLVLAGAQRGNEWLAIPIQLVGVALAVVCFRRGRKLAGLVRPVRAAGGAHRRGGAAAGSTGEFQRVITGVSRS